MQKFVDSYLSFVKKMVPKDDLVPSVGLDIGVSSCKLVEITKKGGSFELVNWAIEPIRGVDPTVAVKAVLAKVSRPAKAPFTAVFGKGTLIRCVSMPRMPLEEARKSLNIEADKYFPFARDQIYTDCYILDKDGQDKKMPVLLAAAKKELIDARIKLMSDAGFHAEWISLNPVALGNVFYATSSPATSAKDAAPQAIAVLDIGETVTSLTVILDRLPRFSRDIFIGGTDLTKRVMHAFNLNAQDAEKLKFDPKEKLNDVINACDASLLNLMTEMRLSFDYFTTENNLHISKLYLSGGTSLLEGIVDYFSKNIDIPVEKWDPLAGISVPANLQSADLKKNASRLGVALGLALYQYD